MKINVGFLLCLLLGLALCGVGVHFLHGYQLRRNAGAFLVQADRAEQEAREAKDPRARGAQREKAAQYLRRYLALRPGDTEARARYGRVLEDMARSGNDLLQALLVY